MTDIHHHVPESLLVSYAAGSLPQPYGVVVASHVSMCLECRSALEAHYSVGGAVLDGCGTASLSAGLKSDILAELDTVAAPEPIFQRSGAYPGPVMSVLKGRPPRWKPLGMGVRQSILYSGNEGSARLLHIPPGQAVPDHGHNGLELTLVLQGSFSDGTGRFGVGDLEVADEDLEHTPVADRGQPCICLAATDAPLRFSSLVPRILQPLFRI